MWGRVLLAGLLAGIWILAVGFGCGWCGVCFYVCSSFLGVLGLWFVCCFWVVPVGLLLVLV